MPAGSDNGFAAVEAPSTASLLASRVAVTAGAKGGSGAHCELPGGSTAGLSNNPVINGAVAVLRLLSWKATALYWVALALLPLSWRAAVL